MGTHLADRTTLLGFRTMPLLIIQAVATLVYYLSARPVTRHRASQIVLRVAFNRLYRSCRESIVVPRRFAPDFKSRLM
jgi:hypothetical protein